MFAVFVAIIVFVLKTRLQRQRNGRMKLTEHHADTLPHPYPEEKTFENPIYQVSKHLTEHKQHCHPSLSPTRSYPSPVPIPHPFLSPTPPYPPPLPIPHPSLSPTPPYPPPLPIPHPPYPSPVPIPHPKKPPKFT